MTTRFFSRALFVGGRLVCFIVCIRPRSCSSSCPPVSLIADKQRRVVSNQVVALRGTRCLWSAPCSSSGVRRCLQRHALIWLDSHSVSLTIRCVSRATQCGTTTLRSVERDSVCDSVVLIRHHPGGRAMPTAAFSWRRVNEDCVGVVSTLFSSAPFPFW